MTTTNENTDAAYLVAEDGTPQGYAERIYNGTYRLHVGIARAGLASGWHFLTAEDLAARGWIAR